LPEVRLYNDATQPTFHPGQTVHLKISPRLHWHVGVELQPRLTLDPHPNAHIRTLPTPRVFCPWKRPLCLFHSL